MTAAWGEIRGPRLKRGGSITVKALKLAIKDLAYQLAPNWSSEVDVRWWARKKVRELRGLTAGCKSPADYVAALDRVGFFQSLQKRYEVLRLLEVVASLQPRKVCEIGAYNGGTLFLFAQMCAPTAEIISIDLEYSPVKRKNFPRFARDGQRIICIEADSQTESTRDRVRSILSGDELDYLFIDGDHSFEGVSRDFELYSPLVRAGGVIAFHDIVPDSWTRTGIPSTNCSGDVPRFWSQLRSRYDGCEEFIEEPNQDGYGIGVLHWPGSGR
jgi:cephalosporin hydroxylase